MIAFIDGPEMQESEEHFYALLGSPVSLVCGYNLIANPSPEVSWTDPQNKQVANGSRYVMENGPEVVRLNIVKASESDNGTWSCTVNVNGSYDSFNPLTEKASTGNIYFDKKEIKVQLTIVGECLIYRLISLFLNILLIQFHQANQITYHLLI